MEFITNTDLLTVITQEVLTEITGANSALIDNSEATAKGQVEDYLSSKYDTDAIFSAGTKNKSIVRIMVDLTLYHAHANLASHNIPELRQKRYDLAIKDLQMMAKGTMNPKDLPLLSDADTGQVDAEGNAVPPGNWGLFSQTKFNSDY